MMSDKQTKSTALTLLGIFKNSDTHTSFLLMTGFRSASTETQDTSSGSSD